MKYLILCTFILATISLRSQSLTFGQIFSYQEKIYNLYNQTPKPLQDITDSLLQRGFIVTDEINESSTTPGVTKIGKTFKLENVQSGTVRESISFTTIETRSPSIKNLVCMTRVETTDFNQYQQWVNDVRKSPNFILAIREGGQYTFRQNVNDTRLTLGPAFGLSPNGNLSVKRPIVYVYEFSLTQNL